MRSEYANLKACQESLRRISLRSPASQPVFKRVHPITLEKWIRAGKVKPSKRVWVGEKAFRVWAARDVERVRKWKAAHYRVGRGRKKKA